MRVLNRDDIEVGDMVKMKYMMFWMLKTQPGKYTDDTAIVIERINTMSMRVMFDSGRIVRDLVEHWEVCKSNQEGVN